jgi:small subunit ribosomal protein S3
LGRKVHPYGFRLKIIRDWQARWYAKKGPQYAGLLIEDLKLRAFVQKEVGHAGVSKVDIERFPNQVIVTVHTAKPGIIIGRKGVAVKVLREQLEKLTNKKVKLEVEEVEKPDMEAALVADNIAQQLERRISRPCAWARAASRSSARAAWPGRKWPAAKR